MKFKFVNGKMIILEATQQLNEAEPATSTATAADSTTTATTATGSAETTDQVFSGITKDYALKLTDKSDIEKAIRDVEKNDPNNRELLNILYGKFIKGNIDPKMKDDYVIPELRLQGIDKVINHQVSLLEFINNVKNSAKFNGQIPNEALVFIKGVSNSDLPAKLIIKEDSALYNNKIFANNRNGGDLVYMLKTFALFNNSRLADKLNNAEQKYIISKDGKNVPFIISKDTFDDFIARTNGEAGEAKKILSKYSVDDERNEVALKKWFEDTLKTKPELQNLALVLEPFVKGLQDKDTIKQTWYYKLPTSVLNKQNTSEKSFYNKNNKQTSTLWNLDVPEGAAPEEVFSIITKWYSETQKDPSEVEKIDFSLQKYLSEKNVMTDDKSIKNHLLKIGKAAFGDKPKIYKNYETKIVNLLSDPKDKQKLLALSVSPDNVANSLEKALRTLIASTTTSETSNSSVGIVNTPLSLSQAVAQILKRTPAQFEKYLTNQIKDNITDPGERQKLRAILSSIYGNEKIVADFMKSTVTPNKEGKINWLDAMVKYYKKLPKKNTKSA